jgi:hypothetical protein
MNELEWIYHMLTHARREKVNITAEGLDLTNDDDRAILRNHQKHTFVFKASWGSTAKIIKVVAADESEAWEKAIKRRDIKGCTDLTLEEERD